MGGCNIPAEGVEYNKDGTVEDRGGIEVGALGIE